MEHAAEPTNDNAAHMTWCRECDGLLLRGKAGGWAHLLVEGRTVTVDDVVLASRIELIGRRALRRVG